jgi:type IV pilus assembly protein PilC
LTRYKYKARNQKGQLISGYAEADSLQLLKEHLRSNGAWLTTAKKVGGVLLSSSSHIRTLELMMFAKQMAVLLNSGVSLLNSLSTMQESASPGFKPVLTRIIEEIKAGHTYSSALSFFPRVFSPFFIGMMEVGEASGLLGEMHQRVSSHLEYGMNLRKKMIMASTYPCMVMLATIGAVVFMLIYAFPKIADVYSRNKVELPLISQVMVSASNFLIYKWYIPVLLVVAIFVAFLGFRIHKKQPLKGWLDQTLMVIPLYGSFYRRIILANFTHNLSLLLTSGVTILRGVDIVKTLLNNSIIKEYMDRIISSIQEGEGLAAYLRTNSFFPPLLVSMVRTGEQSGELSEMMEKAGSFYRQEVEDGATQFTALIEPVLIAFAAGTVFIVLLAFYLPMFKLAKVMMPH